jgi:hypothetical protein
MQDDKPEPTEEQQRAIDAVIRLLSDPDKIERLLKSLQEEPVPWN